MAAKSVLTKRQREQTEKFLHLFADIEQELKRRLKLRRNVKTSVNALARKYLELNPYWSNSADQLALLADVRNILTHNRSATHGYPVSVTNRSVTALESMLKHLRSPETVAHRFRTEVDCVADDASIASVVTAAFDKGYSQFPVLSDRRFVGLITENEITRWLGRQAKNNGSAIDLNRVTVKTVIREKDPFKRDVPIFRFESLDSPVDEVMGMFRTRPMLEAVLLTRSGSGREPIEGIITQWDAARYPDA